MRNKQAKRIRKIVKDNVPTLPAVAYEEVNHREKLYPVGVNVDGTTRFFPVVVSTRVLYGCQRQVYKWAKKRHHIYHGR